VKNRDGKNFCHPVTGTLGVSTCSVGMHWKETEKGLCWGTHLDAGRPKDSTRQQSETKAKKHSVVNGGRSLFCHGELNSSREGYLARSDDLLGSRLRGGLELTARQAEVCRSPHQGLEDRSNNRGWDCSTSRKVQDGATTQTTVSRGGQFASSRLGM